VTAAPLAELVGVSKSYGHVDERVDVLRAVDLAIGAGEKVSLVGRSGSGKSTLLSLLAGLLHPDAGAVRVQQRRLGELSDTERAHLRGSTIGVALQSDNLIPFLTAEENVVMAMSLGGTAAADRTACARRLLDRFGVGDRGDHLPRQLSGGEAQRVALAVSLANDPAVLLADEMVSALDEATAGSVIDRLFTADLAVLYVTHDSVMAGHADRRLRLLDGEVIPA